MSTTSSTKYNRTGNFWGDLWNWSNLMSLTRIITAMLIIWFYNENGYRITWPIIGLVVYGILSDYLDGYIARKRGQVTELGKALDPVSDKISSGMLFLYAVWIGLIPVSYLLFLIGRDLIIMSGALYIRKLTGEMPMAIMSGKISINAVAAYWITAFFAPDALFLQNIFMWLSIVLLVYSFGDYIVRYVKTYRKVHA